jgi:preprotein translocase subunit SecG
MGILIGFLTFILVVNCLFLILLVLIQLPKKDAGAGVAFGGGTTDALFGAGTGNVLTKTTKYCAGLFLAMALILSILTANHQRSAGERLRQELEKKERVPAAQAQPEMPATLTSTNPAPAAGTPAEKPIFDPAAKDAPFAPQTPPPATPPPGNP